MMLNIPQIFITRVIYTTLASCALVCYSASCLAWGEDGHSAIGILAIEQLNRGTRNELESIFGPLDELAMVEACNWPDVVRKTDEWEWSAPLHYVNIPHGDFHYLKSRDCPDGQCVTEAVKEYADQLGNSQLDKETRWQAFAWLCHLTGDLHQPLHSGFADDRGGNDFEIIFEGEQINLHAFWDSALIWKNAGNRQNLVRILSPEPTVETASDWSAPMVNDWTDQSHQLTIQVVYPTSSSVDDIYQQQSWILAQKQLSLAATRLALIINSEFHQGK